MDDVARFASRLIVTHDAQLIYAEPRQLFTQYANMQKVPDIPTVNYDPPRKKADVRTDILTMKR